MTLPDWRVVDRYPGRDAEKVLLGEDFTDEFRIGLDISYGDDGVEVDATVVHPCRTCQWSNTCIEGCHS